MINNAPGQPATGSPNACVVRVRTEREGTEKRGKYKT